MNIVVKLVITLKSFTLNVKLFGKESIQMQIDYVECAKLNKHHGMLLK